MTAQLLRATYLAAFGFVTALPLAYAAPARPLDGPSLALVGTWYGIGEPDDPSISYIDSYLPDGTYRAEFRKCVRNEVVWHERHTGRWSLRNGVLQMLTETIEGKPMPYENNYRIEQSSPDEFHARLTDSGFLFIEKRIPKAEFPPCYVGA
jgi:hypothetical protein